MKTSGPAFRIKLFQAAPGAKWTSHIVRVRGGKVIWSSTSQGYSRRVDAEHEAKLFLRAAKTGRVEISK